MNSAEQCPSWWRPGLTDRQIARWEAAQRCADAAPEIRPGDEVHQALRASWLRPYLAAEQKPDAPAA